ncbi:MAG TPA: HAD family hydrolase [Syntrophorhabdaceae bacterium]|jgi:phosphoglycolate phosphatase
MAGIKGVIFDFDGTLTELTLDFINMRTEIEEIAFRYESKEAVAALEGAYIIEMIYAISDNLGNGGRQFKEEAFDRLRELELSASRGKGVYPYTRDVLRRIRQEGVRLGVITRSCIDVLRAVFPDIDEYAEAIVTREHLREVKPHPRHVLTIAGLLSLSPGEGIMVGDHPTDIEAGRTAGMETAGVLTGRTAKEDFERTGATYIFQDIRGVSALLGGEGPRGASRSGVISGST